MLHLLTYLEAWNARRSATPSSRPAFYDNLLAPNPPQTDLSSIISPQDGVVASEDDFLDDDTEMYVCAFCVCEALIAPSIALRF